MQMEVNDVTGVVKEMELGLEHSAKRGFSQNVLLLYPHSLFRRQL
jgi:hypothetical protein